MIWFYGNRFLLPRSYENKWVAVTKVLSSCGSDYVNVWNLVLSICCASRLAKISTILFLWLGDQRWQAFKDAGVAIPGSARKVVAIPLVYHRAYSAPLPSSHRFPMGWWLVFSVIAMVLKVRCYPESQRKQQRIYIVWVLLSGTKKSSTCCWAALWAVAICHVWGSFEDLERL